MSGLKELRMRIGTIKNIRQVTSAMKMVSAAKLKKAQDKIISFRPYASKLNAISDSVISGIPDLSISEFTIPRDPDKVLIILISSNRGLCGSFNSNIASLAIHLVQTDFQSQLLEGNISFITIGKIGERILKNHKMPVIANRNDLLDHLTFGNISAFTSEMMQNFARGTWDRIELVYNDFVNAAQYRQINEQFLPLQLSGKETSYDQGTTIFEPAREEILKELIPEVLKIRMFKSLILSSAAEQGARMTAMHQATDNATDLLRNLTLRYNQERQAAITKEIMEITGGAEALSK